MTQDQQNKQPEVSEDVVNHIENIVKIIRRNKRKMSISPDHPLNLEIFEAAKGQGYDLETIKQALRILIKQKRIKWGDNINKFWFYPVNTEEDE